MNVIWQMSLCRNQRTCLRPSPRRCWMQLIEMQCLAWESLYTSCKYSANMCSVQVRWNVCSDWQPSLFSWQRERQDHHTNPEGQDGLELLFLPTLHHHRCFCIKIINNDSTVFFSYWYCSINEHRFKQWTWLMWLLEELALHCHYFSNLRCRIVNKPNSQVLRQTEMPYSTTEIKIKERLANRASYLYTLRIWAFNRQQK